MGEDGAMNGNGARPAAATLTVGVVGLGYVGLPLAVDFCEAGHDVIGIDIDARRTDAIAAGRSDIEDITDERLAAIGRRLTPTTRYAALAKADAVIIAVPTPLTPNREPDLGPLVAAASSVAQVLQHGQLVILESTTYPGTTRERLVPLLEESGLAAGADFNVAYSPERIDPGNENYGLRNTPKVVAGLTETCADRAVALYGGVCEEVVRVSTPEVAELTKLLENVFRSVNIALVNELAMLCDRMEIDIWEVVDAAATKPYGFMKFVPGPGMGGHCLPVDPFYLAWRARQFGVTTEFIELAGEVNQQMPYFCADKVARALNDDSKPLRGSRIVILGVSYKAGVGDVRESPALKLVDLLQARGAEVVYSDPYVPELSHAGLVSETLDEALDGCDCAVVVTAHPELDLQRVVDEAPVVVDLRGVTRDIEARNLARL